jgi:hypothetical protein
MYFIQNFQRRNVKYRHDVYIFYFYGILHTNTILPWGCIQCFPPKRWLPTYLTIRHHDAEYYDILTFVLVIWFSKAASRLVPTIQRKFGAVGSPRWRSLSSKPHSENSQKTAKVLCHHKNRKVFANTVELHSSGRWLSASVWPVG